MKQIELIQEVYKACVVHDFKKIAELRKKEFQKIFCRRAQGKTFTGKWTVVSL